MQRMWEAKVQTTRAKWPASNWRHAYVCSAHFTPGSLEERPLMAAEVGLGVKRRRILKPTAVPTILKRTQAAGTDVDPQARPRKAFEKRVADSVLSTKREGGGTSEWRQDEAMEVPVLEPPASHVSSAECQTEPVQKERNTKKSVQVQTALPGMREVRTDQPRSQGVSEMEAAHVSPELPIRWVVSADRTVEIKEEVTELGCDQANERILQEETPPSSVTER
ncbi:uncharacterized protein LOC121310227, partial [Polyodon spathula]|uniref:uncharacterized protein LOC121310227 n=1 Tax=Polyodon spathula TaxID=7913 RepID=UPI001B7E4935